MLDELRVLDAQVQRSLAADEYGVVPNHLRDGIGHFHQPRRYWPSARHRAAVIARENDFEFVLKPALRAARLANAGATTAALNETLTGLTAPVATKPSCKAFFQASSLPRKCFARDFVRVCFSEAANAREHFKFRHPAEQRLNQRLHDNDRAVRRAHIAP